MVTPDRFPGTREEDEIRLVEDTVDPTAEGTIRYVNGVWKFVDSTGLYDPRAGGGLSENSHRALRQLIHFIDNGPAEGFASGAYREITYVDTVFPSVIIWYTDSGKTDKIVELTITYNANKTVNTEIWKMYDTDGATVLYTITDTITYSGVLETSRVRALT